jgi:hypothetical protein
MKTEKPDILNEKEIDFENHMRKIILEKTIVSKNNYFTLFESKNVADIIICRNIIVPKIFFIEVKHYSEKKGRIGFGNSDGSGFQPEILKSKTKYLEDNLIWVFKKENDKNYYVLKSKDCLKYIAGKTIGVKQNNFNISLFEKEKPKNETQFLEYIENWLLDVDEKEAVK